jgi:uncharacterized protein YraI
VLRVACLLFLTMLSAATAQGARTQDVTFARGTSGAVLAGRIAGSDGVTYRLGAAAGQTMRVILTPDNPSCYFNVLAPGASAAMFNGSVSGNVFAERLPSGGTWQVLVYLTRSAIRRGESCRYAIAFGIEGRPPAVTPPPPSVPEGGAGGPDWLAVTGVSANDRLNLRAAPRTDAAIVGRAANGTILRNRGCTGAGTSRWCDVSLPDSPGVRGWASGRFLRESGPPAPSGGFADGDAGGPDWWVVAGVPAGDVLNLRAAPSASAPLVAAFANGEILRNLGCRTEGSSRWCRVERVLGPSGWVSARYLRESGPPN